MAHEEDLRGAEKTVLQQVVDWVPSRDRLSEFQPHRVQVLITQGTEAVTTYTLQALKMPSGAQLEILLTIN
jgi:hypothetical protein